MLRTTSLLLLGAALAAQTASAQELTPVAPTPGGKSPVASARQPASAATAPRPAANSKAASAATAPRPKASAKIPRRVAAKVPAAKAAPKPATPAPEAAPAESGSKSASAAHRDPFVSIIRERGVAGPVCTAAGKLCLVPDQLVLRGVVKSPEGMIALVENAQRKAYFLRENDPVFNGEVVRITRDTIVFRQKVTDRVGRVSTREVVRSLAGGAPA